MLGYTLSRTRRPEVAADLTAEVFASALAAALVADLPSDQRAAVLARIVDERSYADIAAALPRTPGLSGRRLGPGWIVVFGGQAADRRRLLARLRPRL